MRKAGLVMRVGSRWVALALVLWAAGIVVPAGATEDSGEFEIRTVKPLDAAPLSKLRALAASDPEAGALAREAAAAAEPLLGAEPRPLAVIHYEGLVNTDPRRIATVAQLREMDSVAALVRYWQSSGDARAAATLRRFIVAWASVYEPTGNDVNENKLYPLLVAYHALRGTFDADARQRVDRWLESLGSLHARAVQESTHFTNRYTKHVRLLAVIGRILDRPAWRAAAAGGIKRFVDHALRADGTSLDLERRDTLTYHASALRPIIELAMLAGPDGAALYRWEAPRGGSVKTSVDYVVPYALGEKTREEWRNSTVALDHKRAAAGLEHYRAGRLYDPASALGLMEDASYFDPSLLRVVLHLTRSNARRFPSWQSLVNEACRE